MSVESSPFPVPDVNLTHCNSCDLSSDAVDAGALKQLRQLFAGVEHPGLHRALGDADDGAGLFHRFLVVVDEVDDLAVGRRQLGDTGAQDGAGLAAVEGSFGGLAVVLMRVIGAEFFRVMSPFVSFVSSGVIFVRRTNPLFDP